jgi:hypothetical protein
MTEDLPVIMRLNPDGSTTVITTAALHYATRHCAFTVPPGFESDGASLPRRFWRIIGHPFDMNYLREAIGHDYLYRRQRLPRKIADAIFDELLRGRIAAWRRWGIYHGLRLFGWIAWRKNKRMRENN